MIRSLRRRHAVLIPCLALALPLGATLALSGRPRPASGGDWPEELRGPSLQGAVSLGRSRSMPGETGVGVDFALVEVDGERHLRASAGSCGRIRGTSPLSKGYDSEAASGYPLQLPSTSQS